MTLLRPLQPHLLALPTPVAPSVGEHTILCRTTPIGPCIQSQGCEVKGVEVSWCRSSGVISLVVCCACRSRSPFRPSRRWSSGCSYPSAVSESKRKRRRHLQNSICSTGLAAQLQALRSTEASWSILTCIGSCCEALHSEISPSEGIPGRIEVTCELVRRISMK